jgi:hypothetical protein
MNTQCPALNLDPIHLWSRDKLWEKRTILSYIHLIWRGKTPLDRIPPASLTALLTGHRTMKMKLDWIHRVMDLWEVICSTVHPWEKPLILRCTLLWRLRKTLIQRALTVKSELRTSPTSVSTLKFPTELASSISSQSRISWSVTKELTLLR